MKTKIILSIIMLMMLIFISCNSKKSPNNSIKENNIHGLVINNEIIPMDSGISYQTALKAYQQPGKLCLERKVTKKLNWKRDLKYDLYAIYDGKKISLMMGQKIQETSTIYGLMWLLLLCIVIVFGLLIFIRLCESQ